MAPPTPVPSPQGGGRPKHFLAARVAPHPAFGHLLPVGEKGRPLDRTILQAGLHGFRDLLEVRGAVGVEAAAAREGFDEAVEGDDQRQGVGDGMAGGGERQPLGVGGIDRGDEDPEVN